VVKAAVNAYEAILEYLDNASDRIVKAIDPLNLKHKKLNLSTDSDKEVRPVSNPSSVKSNYQPCIEDRSIVRTQDQDHFFSH